MRKNLIFALLIAFSQSACTKPDGEPVTYANLSGNWSGDYQTQQIGSCTGDGQPTTTTATFQTFSTTYTTGTVKATVVRTTGPNSISFVYTGTINGNNVVMSNTNNAICNGVPRTYTARFEGTVSGNTLTMVSRDTLCPTLGCIFLRTLRLTR